MRQAGAMLLAHARRNDQLGEFFADGLGSAKTKSSLGSRIKLEDAPVSAHGNDAIERRIENAAIQHFELGARDSFTVWGPLFGFHRSAPHAPPCRARLTSLTRGVQ